MPIINAQGGVFRQWEGLLNACRSHAALLPNSDNMRAELEDLLRQAREIKAQQEEHEGRRQFATQQLGTVIERGQETSRRLRGFAKALLGTKSELLVQFGTSPIRRRSRRRREEPPVVKDAAAPADTATSE